MFKVLTNQSVFQHIIAMWASMLFKTVDPFLCLILVTLGASSDERWAFAEPIAHYLHRQGQKDVHVDKRRLVLVLERYLLSSHKKGGMGEDKKKFLKSFLFSP